MNRARFRIYSNIFGKGLCLKRSRQVVIRRKSCLTHAKSFAKGRKKKGREGHGNRITRVIIIASDRCPRRFFKRPRNIQEGDVRERYKHVSSVNPWIKDPRLILDLKLRYNLQNTGVTPIEPQFNGEFLRK